MQKLLCNVLIVVGISCVIFIIDINNNYDMSQRPNTERSLDASQSSSSKQYKVFTHGEPLMRLHNSLSATLIPTIDGQGEEHDAEVIWTARAFEMRGLAPLAAESMWIRLQSHGKIKSTSETPDIGHMDIDQLKTLFTNFTQDELNKIDPDWKIFFIDHTDRGIGNQTYWYFETKLSHLIGWKRIHYATRATQHPGRNMGAWVNAMNKKKDPSLPFDGYLGGPMNFTRFLGHSFRSIHRLSLLVREDIANAIEEYMKDKHPKEHHEAANNNDDDGETGITNYELSAAIARLPRPMDVRTFWNSTVCNMRCQFRNYISEIVHSIPDKHANITTNTDVVGFIHKMGRNNVHPDYIKGMMKTKIIVLAQRDSWEGHNRLYEALLSGALVLTDPQIYWPHGTIDGENLVVYNSWYDLEKKILYYLEHDEERVMIGQRGREVALTYHRSWQQAERLYLNDMTYKNDCGLFNKP